MLVQHICPLFFGMLLRLLLRSSNYCSDFRNAHYFQGHCLEVARCFSWSEIAFNTLGLMETGSTIQKSSSGPSSVGRHLDSCYEVFASSH